VIAVAMDVQGAELARPYVEIAKADHANLVDAENILGDLIGFKAVPNTILIDEAGRYQGMVSPDEAKEWATAEGSDVPSSSVQASASSNGAGRIRALEALADWLPRDASVQADLAERYLTAGRGEAAEAAFRRALTLGASDAPTHFRYGRLLLSLGRKDEGIASLRRALAVDSGNYVIRKQIWALENPGRFYDGGIDWDWQKEQSQREAAAD
jgi:tetratricopeptide (TPR) repeat protein